MYRFIGDMGEHRANIGAYHQVLEPVGAGSVGRGAFCLLNHSATLVPLPCCHHLKIYPYAQVPATNSRIG